MGQKPQAVTGIFLSVVVFAKEEAIIIKNSMVFVRIRPERILCMGCRIQLPEISIGIKPGIKLEWRR